MIVAVYSLQPWNIQQLTPKGNITKGLAIPKPRSGHRIVAENGSIYSFGGYNPHIPIDDEELIDDVNWQEYCPLFKELWKFNIPMKTWIKQVTAGDEPYELASHCAVLLNNQMLIYGGTGVPFGSSSSNKLTICNLKTMEWHLVPTHGESPEQRYGQAVAVHKDKFYVVGGTTGFEYSIDVHQLDPVTKQWTELHSTNKPRDRYRHELAVLDNKIFVIGGGTAMASFGFRNVPTFYINQKRWRLQKTQPDTSCIEGYPSARRCHGCVQNNHELYIIGGYNGQVIFPDVWKLDLLYMKWTKLMITLPVPVYFHSTALSPNGKLYIFGGVDSILENTRTNNLYEVWLTIPKLKEACWEAILTYIPQIGTLPRGYLLRLGIPLDFINRINFEKFVEPEPA
ncbi:KLHDC10 (predicted) [Pycnogonum litorale]